MSLLHLALGYAARGWHVFPVEAGGKTPRRLYPHRPPEQAPWILKWGDVATTNVNQIVQWWTEYPDSNIGVACAPSGLLVVDCDVPNPNRPSPLKGTPYANLLDRFDGYADGADVFREMCIRSKGDWPEILGTYTVATGSGGGHFYTQWPAGVQATQASLLRGALDIRCNGGDKGGYVLAAGSVTEKGPYAVEVDAPVIDCPQWLLERCREQPRVPRVARTGIQQPSYAGNFSGILRTVREAADGNGNFTIYWAAIAMCDDGATQEQATALILEATAGWTGTRCSEKDISDTVRSGFRRRGH